MFQLAEFVSMVLISILGSLIFLGGWQWPVGGDVPVVVQVVLMAVKTTAFIIFFMWMRGTMPRLRVDQLMAYCWQLLLPFAFLQIIINGLALAYGWEEWTLTVMSGAATAGFLYLTYRGARQAGVVYQPAMAEQRVGSVL